MPTFLQRKNHGKPLKIQKRRVILAKIECLNFDNMSHKRNSNVSKLIHCEWSEVPAVSIKNLIEDYPEDFATYAEKILDSYFGNIFVSYKNEKILYANARLAASIHMTKEQVTNLTMDELRSQKLWIRSISQEMYEERFAPFNAYNVSKWGDELFTHVEPIYNDEGDIIMSAHFSIPRKMLTEFSEFVSTERSVFHKHKDVLDYLNARKNMLEPIVCNSPAAQATFSTARYLAGLDSVALLCGETGTGKDVLANYIYQNSKRSDQPFVPVNCSAIPEGLVESELFGYEQGAFTSARSSGKPGVFEMADQGTLFLDEIEELSLPAQAKLLRVLETGKFMRVGGTRIISTDVRVIAATNRNLEHMVAEKQFRKDLYYRLNVMPLYLPPLRDRKEDIIPLGESFLAKNNRKYGTYRELTENIRQTLLEYDWPGNIRELRNVIERYAISGRIDLFSSAPAVSDEADWDRHLALDEETPLHSACAKFERAYIKRALAACGGSVTKAAERLGIHRSLLYKKLKKIQDEE